jgi:hypothetical protein
MYLQLDLLTNFNTTCSSVSLPRQLKTRLALLLAIQGYTPTHHTVEDKTYFPAGITLLQACTVCCTGPQQLYSKCKIFWEMPSKRNRNLWSNSEKEERETDKQWNDKRQASLIHRITGGERCFDLKPSHRKDWPSTSWLEVQNSDH